MNRRGRAGRKAASRRCEGLADELGLRGGRRAGYATSLASEIHEYVQASRGIPGCGSCASAVHIVTQVGRTRNTRGVIAEIGPHGLDLMDEVVKEGVRVKLD